MEARIDSASFGVDDGQLSTDNYWSMLAQSRFQQLTFQQNLVIRKIHEC